MQRIGPWTHSSALSIQLVNTVDSESPPTDFIWSDDLVLPGDVQQPVDEGGCSCFPVCDPEIAPCACTKRALLFSAFRNNPDRFVYERTNQQDGAGRSLIRLSRDAHGPIVECNASCSCNITCVNRTIQNPSQAVLRLQKTVHKGWGVFAAQDILANTYISVMTGEMVRTADIRDRGSSEKTNPRCYLIDLEFWNLAGYMQKRNPNKYNANWKPTWSVDCSRTGNVSRFFNHSCDPNLTVLGYYSDQSDRELPTAVFFTSRDVKQDEELCMNYFGDKVFRRRKVSQKQSEPQKDQVFCACGAPKCCRPIIC